MYHLIGKNSESTEQDKIPVFRQQKELIRFTRRRVSDTFFQGYQTIGHYRNVRGLGKSMVIFRLFEKLRYSNERSTMF